MRKHHLLGQTFGRLTVLSEGIKNNKLAWNCRCECGKERTLSSSQLVTGNTKSCGCFYLESVRKTENKSRTHGFTGTLIGNSWQGMIKRCYRKSQRSYKDYGAKGVYVCEFLRATPLNLKTLLGDRTNGMSIDRIDVLGSYTCGTCAECSAKEAPLNVRWSDNVTQARNKRNSVMVEIGGEVKNLTDWSDKFGLTRRLVYDRWCSGWRGESLFGPKRKNQNG